MKRTVMAMAIAAAAFAFAACAATSTEALRERLLSGERNCVFAAMLRGDWRNFPENSRSAILSAIERGADIVEIDVRRTRVGRRHPDCHGHGANRPPSENL